MKLGSKINYVSVKKFHSENSYSILYSKTKLIPQSFTQVMLNLQSFSRIKWTFFEWLMFCYKFKQFYYNSKCSVSYKNFQLQNRVGIEQRCDLGFLLWDKNASRTSAFNIGSRLKTPVLPLWVTRCNDVIGILFNPNKELLRSHNAEKRFF